MIHHLSDINTAKTTRRVIPTTGLHEGKLLEVDMVTDRKIHLYYHKKDSFLPACRLEHAFEIKLFISYDLLDGEEKFMYHLGGLDCLLQRGENIV